MEFNVDLGKRITNALYTDNSEELETIVSELASLYNGKNFFDMLNSILNSDMTLEDKIKFLIEANKYSKGKHTGFFYELLPYGMSQCIKRYKDEFINIVSNNESIQEGIADYFKSYPTEIIEIWNQISGLPKVKEIVLEDEDFVSQNMRKHIRFYEGLPKEYGYLIALYDSRGGRELGNISNLYFRFFENVISDDEINELINLQMEINNEPNLLQLSTKDKMKEIEYVLKQTLRDRKFYKKMKQIQTRTNLELREIIQFTYKYNDTLLYKQLTDENVNINDELIEKLKYLAKEGRIDRIETIEDLTNATFEELEQMDKQKRSGVQSSLRGGPNSRTMDRIFPDGEGREIRRIDKDGRNVIMPVDSFYNHEDIVKRIYEDSVEFPEDCTMAIERSSEAAKQISSVTFIIENEQCFIYAPSDITNEQKRVCEAWIKTAIDSGKFGIFVYDREKDESYIADEEIMEKDKAMQYLNNINNRTIEEMDR